MPKVPKSAGITGKFAMKSVVITGVMLAAAALAWAQSKPVPVGSALSSPIAPKAGASGASAPKAGASASSTPNAGASAGGFDIFTSGRSGGAVHSPLSQFAPLVERPDVLSWGTLNNVSTKTEKTKVLPVYPSNVLALNHRKQRVQGFMMPLQTTDKHTHFLLTQVPMSCGFCTPGGPESIIEVRTKTPVKYGLDAMVFEGEFRVLTNDDYGLYYRITDAVQVR
jgi:uncharacterized protein